MNGQESFFWPTGVGNKEGGQHQNLAHLPPFPSPFLLACLCQSLEKVTTPFLCLPAIRSVAGDTLQSKTRRQKSLVLPLPLPLLPPGRHESLEVQQTSRKAARWKDSRSRPWWYQSTLPAPGWSPLDLWFPLKLQESCLWVLGIEDNSNTTKCLLEPSPFLTECQHQESGASKEAGRRSRGIIARRCMVNYEMRREKRKGNKEGTDVRDTQKNHTQVSSFTPKPKQNEKRNINMKETLHSC